MKNSPNINIERVNPEDKELINLIAQWYYEEWKIPVLNTEQKLGAFPKEEIPFHIIIKENNIPIATGGLHTHVGLLDVLPEYKKYKHWVAVIYTIPEKRGNGYGGMLCNFIEKMAKEFRLTKLHLCTFTAENLYLRLNWKPLNRITYKEHKTVVMEKEI